MITLIRGGIQEPDGVFTPFGSISFQLNMDATVLAPPGGQVFAAQETVFQLDQNGLLVQPAKIYSNAELNPQNAVGMATYYLVTIYDANGARINTSPMWWIFPSAPGSIVDISTMTLYLIPGVDF